MTNVNEDEVVTLIENSNFSENDSSDVFSANQGFLPTKSVVLERKDISAENVHMGSDNPIKLETENTYDYQKISDDLTILGTPVTLKLTESSILESIDAGLPLLKIQINYSLAEGQLQRQNADFSENGTIESLRIFDLPDGAVVIDGAYNADGSVSVSFNDSGTIIVELPLDQILDLGTSSINTGQAATVTVTGTNDGPVATDDVLTGTEDTTIAFTMSDFLVNDSDIDGKTLSITSFEQPDNGIVIDNGDGSFTFTPDTNWNGRTSFTYNISDGAGGVDTATVTITVDGVVDAATITTSDVTGYEDAGIALNINVAGPDTITSIVINNVPDGATLSAGMDNGDGTWNLGESDLAGLTITPPADSDTDFQLGVSVTTTDGDQTITTNNNINVDVIGIADAPTISATIGLGVAHGGVMAVDVSPSIIDAAGTSNAIVTIAGVPDWATLSAGTNNGDGTWTINNSADLVNLTISSVDQSSGNVSLSFDVTGQGSGTVLVSEIFDLTVVGWSGETTAVSGAMDIDYNDSATKIFDFGAEHAGQTILISFDYAGQSGWDQSGRTSRLDYLEVSANGEVLYRDSDKSGIASLTTTLNANGQIEVGFSVDTSGRENMLIDNFLITAGSDWSSHTLATEIIDVAVAPPTFKYPVSIAASLADLDGSETLSITVANLPAGAEFSAGTDNGDGTYSFSQGDLSGLEISVPADTGDFAFTVSVTSAENDGSTLTVSKIMGVDLSALDTSFEQLSDGGSSWNNDVNSISDDVILGGDGDDFINTGPGNDTIDGAAGNDTIDGGSGDDAIFGGDGADTLYGGADNDALYGDAGNDTISGGDGQDTIFGGQGDDLIDGNAGNDTLVGGIGNDELYGGDGSDQFIYNLGQGNDVVHGGLGADWLDSLDLQTADNSHIIDKSWSVDLDSGYVVSELDSYIELSQDASGSITFDDGAVIEFDGIEKIQW